MASLWAAVWRSGSTAVGQSESEGFSSSSSSSPSRKSVRGQQIQDSMKRRQQLQSWRERRSVGRDVTNSISSRRLTSSDTQKQKRNRMGTVSSSNTPDSTFAIPQAPPPSATPATAAENESNLRKKTRLSSSDRRTSSSSMGLQLRSMRGRALASSLADASKTKSAPKGNSTTFMAGLSTEDLLVRARKRLELESGVSASPTAAIMVAASCASENEAGGRPTCESSSVKVIEAVTSFAVTTSSSQERGVVKPSITKSISAKGHDFEENDASKLCEFGQTLLESASEEDQDADFPIVEAHHGEMSPGEQKVSDSSDPEESDAEEPWAVNGEEQDDRDAPMPATPLERSNDSGSASASEAAPPSDRNTTESAASCEEDLISEHEDSADHNEQDSLSSQEEHTTPAAAIFTTTRNAAGDTPAPWAGLGQTLTANVTLRHTGRKRVAVSSDKMHTSASRTTKRQATESTIHAAELMGGRSSDHEHSSAAEIEADTESEEESERYERMPLPTPAQRRLRLSYVTPRGPVVYYNSAPEYPQEEKTTGSRIMGLSRFQSRPRRKSDLASTKISTPRLGTTVTSAFLTVKPTGVVQSPTPLREEIEVLKQQLRRWEQREDASRRMLNDERARCQHQRDIAQDRECQIKELQALLDDSQVTLASALENSVPLTVRTLEESAVNGIVGHGGYQKLLRSALKDRDDLQKESNRKSSRIDELESNLAELVMLYDRRMAAGDHSESASGVSSEVTDIRRFVPDREDTVADLRLKLKRAEEENRALRFSNSVVMCQMTEMRGLHNMRLHQLSGAKDALQEQAQAEAAAWTDLMTNTVQKLQAQMLQMKSDMEQRELGQRARLESELARERMRCADLMDQISAQHPENDTISINSLSRTSTSTASSDSKRNSNSSTENSDCANASADLDNSSPAAKSTSNTHRHADPGAESPFL